jgi:hypothetical protein
MPRGTVLELAPSHSSGRSASTPLCPLSRPGTKRPWPDEIPVPGKKPPIVPTPVSAGPRLSSTPFTSTVNVKTVATKGSDDSLNGTS